MDHQKLTVLETAQKLQLLPQLSRKVRALRQVYLTSPGLQAETEKAILQLADRHKEQFLLEHPNRQQAAGDYPLGLVHCGSDRHPFALLKGELLKHMGIYAMTGGGKSTALDALVWNLCRDKVPFMLFDWTGSHRHLLSRLIGKDISYFTPGSALCPFPFNPNRVADSFTPQQHLSYLNTLYYSLTERHLKTETLNKEGVRFLLMRLAEELLKDGEEAFTFAQLQEKAKSIELNHREREWRTTLLNFLYRLTTGPASLVYNSKAHLPPKVLLSQQSLIDLSGLIHPLEKADFIESFLFNLYECHLKGLRHAGSDELRLVVVIEEIHHIGNSILESFFREMRKWGAGLVFTAQHPSLVSRQIRGNCHTTVCQNLESPEDMETAGDTLLLDRRKLPYLGDEFSYLSRIKAGSGLYICKLQSRYTRPFLLHIPSLRPAQEPKDEEIASRMKPYYSRMGLDALEGTEVMERQQGLDQALERVARSLSDRAKKLLFDIAQNPLSKVTDRYERLQFNGHLAKGELVDQGLVDQKEFTNGQGKVVVLQLTEMGKEALAVLGRPIGRPIDQATNHDFARDELAWALEHELGWQGVKTEKPMAIGGKEDPDIRVDIHAERNGKKVSFQVESGKSYYLRNILFALKAGYDCVVSVALDKATKEEIKQRLGKLEGAGLRLGQKAFVVSQAEVRDFVRGYLNVVL